uniref:DUF3327 domain-containing protein n=1 Tax=Macrostomum lignano TaxID=282301 RepID=A0A1I8F5N6_9PLAT
MKHDKPRYFYSMAPRRTDQKDAVVDENDNYISFKCTQEAERPPPTGEPIERGGVVINWTTWRRSGTHAFTTSSPLAPEEHPVVLDGSRRSIRKPTARQWRSMFETFNVPSILHWLVAHNGTVNANCLWTPVSYWNPATAISTAMHVYDNEILPNTTFRLDLARPRPHRQPGADANERRLQLHQHTRAQDRPRHQGEAVLRRHGLRKRDADSASSRSLRQRLTSCRRSGRDHHRQTKRFRTARRDPVPAVFF